MPSRHAARARAPFAVLVLSFALLLAAASGRAGAAGKGDVLVQGDYVGLNGHFVWQSATDSLPELKRMRSGGPGWLREDFPWRVIEPSKGAFDWSRTDALMSAAAQADLNVLANLDYSAPWASSDPTGAGDEHYPPRNPADYAAYAAAVVKRYGPNGSFWASRPDLTPHPVRAVELWNEPWGYWSWKPNPNPVAYAALAHAAAVAIRAADPSVTILLSGDLDQVRTDGALVSWLDAVLAADPELGRLVNAYSVHPYPSPRNLGPYAEPNLRWNYGRVRLIRDVAVARNAALPIWITEIGWSTAGAVGDDGVSEATQATYVHDAVERAAKEWPYVQRVFVYSWDRSNGIPTDREGNYGLRRADDSTKPAWDALVSVIDKHVSTGGNPNRGQPKLSLQSAASGPSLVVHGRLLAARALSGRTGVRHARRVVTIFRVTRRDWVWFANVRTSASGAFRLAWRARRQRPLRLVAMTRIARTAIRSPVVRIGRRG